MGFLSKKSSHIWIMVGVLLVLWGFLLFRIDKPFYGYNENPFAWIGATVRLYNEYGPQSTNFLPIYTPGPSTPETAQYYLHHPPLIVWFAAIATKLFGYNPDSLRPYELSLRMVAIIATMLTLPIFYAFARRVSSAGVALLAFIFYAFAPVTIYYGRMPYYDMLIMPAILAFAYHFVFWMQNYSIKQSLILIFFGILAMWIDWTAGFYFAAFGLIAFVYGKREQRIGILIIGVVVGLATLAIPLIYIVLNEDTLNQLKEAVFTRTISQKVTPTETFALDRFMIRLIGHMFQMLSISTFILGLIGIGIIIRRKMNLENVVILGFLGATFIFMVVARNPFYFHDWYKLHYLPVFAIAAGIATVSTWKLKPRGIKVYARPLVFALIVCTLFASVFVTANLYQDVFPFAESLSEELPQYTAEEDFIATNFSVAIYPVEFYAYRNIIWGAPPDEILRILDEESSVDIHYLLYLGAGNVNNYDGELSQYDYIAIANEFRLIHITKP